MLDRERVISPRASSLLLGAEIASVLPWRFLTSALVDTKPDGAVSMNSRKRQLQILNPSD
jgi:hypothetical protein